jgi:hypothetical protein
MKNMLFMLLPNPTRFLKSNLEPRWIRLTKIPAKIASLSLSEKPFSSCFFGSGFELDLG